MMSRKVYLQIYDSLPEEAKQAMRDLEDVGINDSGLWVRFGNVEATVGKIVLALQKKAVLNSAYGIAAGAPVYNDSESLKEED